MGREVRRVPANWEHPKDEHGEYRPMFNRSYLYARAKWLDGLQAWMSGTHPDYIKYGSQKDGTPCDWWEWTGNPPDRDSYRPDWPEDERTHLQLYETVSEGTPISPVFATAESLALWYASNGDPVYGKSLTYEECLAFIQKGWAPSGVLMDGRYMSGVEAIARGLGKTRSEEQ